MIVNIVFKDNLILEFQIILTMMLGPVFLAGNWLWSWIVNRRTAPTTTGAPLGDINLSGGVRRHSHARTPSPGRRTSTPAGSSIERPSTAVISGFENKSPERKVTPTIRTKRPENSSVSSSQQSDKWKTSTDEGRRSQAAEALEVLRVEGQKLQEVINRLGSSILGIDRASATAENFSMEDFQVWEKED